MRAGRTRSRSSASATRRKGVVLRARRRRSRSTVSTSPRDRMIDELGLRRGASGAGRFRIGLGGGQRAGDVEQLLFRESDERPAQQRAKSKRVAPVGQARGRGQPGPASPAAGTGSCRLARREAIPLSSSARSYRQRSVPAGASRAISPGTSGPALSVRTADPDVPDKLPRKAPRPSRLPPRG